MRASVRACVRVCDGGGWGGWVVDERGYVLVCLCILVYVGGGVWDCHMCLHAFASACAQVMELICVPLYFLVFSWQT